MTNVEPKSASVIRIEGEWELSYDYECYMIHKRGLESAVVMVKALYTRRNDRLMESNMHLLQVVHNGQE